MVLLMGFGVLCRWNQVTGAWYQTTDVIAIGIITRIYLLPSVRSEEKENFSRGYINFKTCHCKIKKEMKRIAWYSSDEIPVWQVKIAICNWYNVNICCEVFFFYNLPDHCNWQNPEYCGRRVDSWRLHVILLDSAQPLHWQNYKTSWKNICFFRFWVWFFFFEAKEKTNMFIHLDSLLIY